MKITRRQLRQIMLEEIEREILSEKVDVSKIIQSVKDKVEKIQSGKVAEFFDTEKGQKIENAIDIAALSRFVFPGVGFGLTLASLLIDLLQGDTKGASLNVLAMALPATGFASAKFPGVFTKAGVTASGLESIISTASKTQAAASGRIFMRTLSPLFSEKYGKSREEHGEEIIGQINKIVDFLGDQGIADDPAVSGVLEQMAEDMAAVEEAFADAEEGCTDAGGEWVDMKCVMPDTEDETKSASSDEPSEPADDNTTDSESQSLSESTTSLGIKITQMRLRQIVQEEIQKEYGRGSRAVPTRPDYGEGNLTISDVQKMFPSLSPGEQDDIWEKYKHLNNAGELKAAVLGL